MPKICSHKGCGTPVFSRGLCMTHWRAWKGSQRTLVQTTNGKKAKPFKAISDKQSKRLAKYRVVRDEYLKEHPTCEYPGCASTQVELHHSAGRCGDLLFAKEHFVSLCRTHHRIIETSPIEAKILGLSKNRLDK